MKERTRFNLNLRERCEIIKLAKEASKELNASQLIDWFEEKIEQKKESDLVNQLQNQDEFFEVLKVYR
ncbi:hypothetical protein [Jejuia spongiicola]|uniref:CopG family transcriptional regulator n=1 Tax=Jejuia spongiicola TaxID=2942207 RepID=A0ABT0QC26_9FLAO|nr:hypothetical protein [Jejuia spongiicola]MCL6294527.1 hypothetical protein [Jejuia spongiicola]